MSPSGPVHRRQLGPTVKAAVHDDAAVHLPARDALRAFPAGRVVTALAKFLGGADRRRRRRVVEALGDVGGPAAVRLLAAALEDDDPEVRHQAALSLGMTKTLRARRLLRATLRDGDADLRSAAAAGLGKLGDRASLRAALHDSSEGVRQNAAYNLRSRAALDLHALIEALSDRSADVRVAAVMSLEGSPAPLARDALVQACRDGSAPVRRWAAHALVGVEVPAARAALRRRVLDRDASVRVAAAYSLVPSVVPPYLRAQRQARPPVRDDPGAGPSLVAALEFTDEQTRVAVVGALRGVGDERCVRALVAAAGDRRVSRAAVAALVAVLRRAGPQVEPPDLSAVQRLKPARQVRWESDPRGEDRWEAGDEPVEVSALRAIARRLAKARQRHRSP